MNKDPSHASNESQEDFADFSKFENTLHPNENLSRHRRSASLDSTHVRNDVSFLTLSRPDSINE